MFRLRSTIPALALALALAPGALAQNTGTPFCNLASNYTALTGSFGSGVGSDLHLEVTQGVPGEFGYFLAGTEATSGVVISNGSLCLVGTGTAQVFRYNVAGTVSNSLGHFDNAGVFQNLVGTSASGGGFDVPDTIPGNTPITIMTGDTWHFQMWHRDSAVQAGDSNFSNGLSVTFQGALPVPIPGMVPIPAGSFDMGSTASALAPYNNQGITQPVHNVTISEAFWMGEREVTQEEHLALMGSNPAAFSGVNLPVENLNWHDARAYCTALTAQETAAGNLPSGYEYRLPTEAEWEYACRAGTTTEFNVGQELFCSEARFWLSLHSGNSCGVPIGAGTTAVGSYPANAFGLHDMHGNVWEWCLDSLGTYPSGPVTDPLGTGSNIRIFRGGSWFQDSSAARSAARGSRSQSVASYYVGLRVVLGRVVVP